MRILTVITALLTLLALPVNVIAQEDWFIWFYASGDGDLLDCPPIFTGGMNPGGDVVNGSWSITVCDHGWPTDPTERNTYIWETFFADSYTSGDPAFWTGVFDVEHGQPHMNPIAIVDETNGGTLGGACAVEYQVPDLNGNGVLDEGEFCDGYLGGLIVILSADEGTGFWDGRGGTGNYFGSFNRACPSTHDGWDFGMYLWLEYGPAPVHTTTWTSVKDLYK